MNKEQLQELLTYVTKTYGFAVATSLLIAFDNETEDREGAYGSIAMECYIRTCQSVVQLSQ